MSQSRFTAPALVLAGAVLWGTTGTAQAFAPEGASPLAVGAVRLAVGGFALLLPALLRGSLHLDRSWPKGALFLSAASMAAYQPFFFAGVAAAGVAVGTVVTIGSAPVLAGLLAYAFRRERPGARWFLATGLAVGGCLLLFLPWGSGEAGGGAHPLGVVLALAAGLSYAAFAVASKGLLERRPPEAVMALVFALSAVMLSPLLFTQELAWLREPRGWLVALHLGLLATALAYSLFSRGLALIPVAAAVTLTLAEPLTAALLGAALLGERLSPPALLGVGLLLSGLVVMAKVEKKKTT
jgi:drug/metabolite transporter, DME family